jgi:hypothetical protein
MSTEVSNPASSEENVFALLSTLSGKKRKISRYVHTGLISFIFPLVNFPSIMFIYSEIQYIFAGNIATVIDVNTKFI